MPAGRSVRDGGPKARKAAAPQPPAIGHCPQASSKATTTGT